MYESRHTYECVTCIFVMWLVHIWHPDLWHGSLMCGTWLTYFRKQANASVPWLIHVCDMTHSCVHHDSFICVPWLVCDMTQSYVGHDVFKCTWKMSDGQRAVQYRTTHSHVWPDSFICLPWLIYMWAITRSYVWHDSIICVPQLTQMHLENERQKKSSAVSHNAFTRVTWQILESHAPWRIHMCAMTYSHVRHVSFICAPDSFKYTWKISPGKRAAQYRNASASTITRTSGDFWRTWCSWCSVSHVTYERIISYMSAAVL